jgi:TonB-dependent starch-binding outer membrane protein SusC
MRNRFKNTRILILLCIWALSLTQAFAQELQITGKVTDKSNGEALPGVNITIKGTNQGAATDMSGKYTIKVNSGSTLVFSFIGYINEERIVESAQTIDVELTLDVKKLEEVVVIGYGTVKKNDLTGSVNAVGSRNFTKGITNSPQDLISGKVAGVAVTSGNGAPGSAPTVRIRGTNSLNANQDPLYVVDGVVLDNGSISGLSNTLAFLNPNDIETYTILKDASATAIYGSRATNGVIIITTKKGNKNMHISYNGTYTVNSLPKMLDVLNGDEYRTLITEQIASGYLASGAASLLGTANTDWQKEIYRTSFSQDHNLGISGTIKKVLPYRFSFGYTKSDGTLKATDFKRLTANINLNPTLLKGFLKINLNVKGMYNENNFGATGAIGAATAFNPTFPVMNGNTRWRGYTTWITDNTDINGNPNTNATSNPVALIDLRKDFSFVKRSIGNVQFDYKVHFFPDLHVNVNLAYDYSKTKGHVNVADSTAWTYNNPNEGRLETYNETRKKQLLETFLNYEKELPDINSKINAMAGYSWEYFYKANDDTAIYKSGAELSQSASKTRYYLVSFYGRLNYELAGRYILTATLRNDGTSRFSEDNRWGLFPSGAFAWKIKQESFLKNINVLSDLKLRVGIGVTGQQELNTGDFPYLAVFKTSSQYASYQLGDEFYYTLRPNAYDANIKWESTTTKNIALDFGLFNNRLTGTIEYYTKKTNDMISTVNTAAGSNLSNSITTNVGDMKNKGFEFTLSGDIISSKDLNWELSGNIAYNKNEITKLTMSENSDYYVQTGSISGGTGNKIQVQKVGEPLNSFFVYQQVYDSNGNPIDGVYVDRDGNGVINSGDLYCYKSPMPDYTLGISSRLNYKKWEFSFSGRASFGNYMYNNVASGSTYASLYTSNFLSNINYSANETKFKSTQYFSDYYVENASFFKMDNIALSYNTPILNKKVNLKVSGMVQNAFVITKYKGLDPEIYSGIDNNVYPRSRAYILGLNLEF